MFLVEGHLGVAYLDTQRLIIGAREEILITRKRGIDIATQTIVDDGLPNM